MGQAFAETQTAPLTLQDGTLRLRILIDSSPVEVYGDQGEVALTDLVFPDVELRGVAVRRWGHGDAAADGRLPA